MFYYRLAYKMYLFVQGFCVPRLRSKHLRGADWPLLGPSMYFKILRGCYILGKSSTLNHDDIAFIKIRKSFAFLTTFMNYL